MRKSKNMFVIMAIVYLIIAILGFRGYISISNNILFGLSLSALLSGMNDTLENIKSINTAKNELGFIVNITCGFLDNIISNNPINTNSTVNIRNLKLNIESNCKNYKLAIHPNEYMKKHFVFMLHVFS